MSARQTSWITPSQAAQRAEVTPESVIRWCERYSLGRKVAGRWRIDPAALERFLADAPTCGGDDATRAV